MNHAGKAKVGDIVRAYDFRPMAGRDDAFVEGIVENANCYEPGYHCFKITVTADKFEKYETTAHKENRVGRIVFVPHRVSFMEWSGRVINLTE